MTLQKPKRRRRKLHEAQVEVDGVDEPEEVAVEEVEEGDEEVHA
jgi:hypothetical protein